MFKIKFENRIIECRGILFDMDGVLIDSTEADEKTWLRWARFHQMEESFNVKSTHGRRTADSIRMLRPDLDQAGELSRIEQYDLEQTDGFLKLPGAERLMSTIPGNRWTIVTSASKRAMKSRLTFAGLAVPENTINAESVANGKPHPDPYLAGAKLLGLDPKDCIVIEDAPNGVRAGKQAGCIVIAVTQSHGPEELHEADWIISSIDQIQIEINANINQPQ